MVDFKAGHIARGIDRARVTVFGLCIFSNSVAIAGVVGKKLDVLVAVINLRRIQFQRHLELSIDNTREVSLRTGRVIGSTGLKQVTLVGITVAIRIIVIATIRDGEDTGLFLMDGGGSLVAQVESARQGRSSNLRGRHIPIVVGQQKAAFVQHFETVRAVNVVCCAGSVLVNVGSWRFLRHVDFLDYFSLRRVESKFTAHNGIVLYSEGAEAHCAVVNLLRWLVSAAGNLEIVALSGHSEGLRPGTLPCQQRRQRQHGGGQESECFRFHRCLLVLKGLGSAVAVAAPFLL